MNVNPQESDSFEVFSDQEVNIQREDKSKLKERNHLIGEIYSESISDSFDLIFTPMDHNLKIISPQTDYLTSEGLENAIKVINDHEKAGTDPNCLVNELASLKSEMDKCDKKMEGQAFSFTKVAYFVSKYFGLGGMGYASLLYTRTLNRLSEEQKSNAIALSSSYGNLSFHTHVKNLILPEGKGVYTGRVDKGIPCEKGEVKNLILPEGKGLYSGHLLNGVPHGAGEVTNYFLAEGKFYTGPLLNGQPDGLGVIFTPECVSEIYCQNGEIKEKIDYKYVEDLELNDGTYTGFTHKEEPAKQGFLRKSNGDIFVGEFFEGKLIEGVIFLQDGTMLSTVVDPETSVSQKAFGEFKKGFFTSLGLNGEGEIIKQDGTIERGNFFKGKLNGYGERDFKVDGKIVSQKGTFENGEFKNEI